MKFPTSVAALVLLGSFVSARQFLSEELSEELFARDADTKNYRANLAPGSWDYESLHHGRDAKPEAEPEPEAWFDDGEFDF